MIALGLKLMFAVIFFVLAVTCGNMVKNKVFGTASAGSGMLISLALIASALGLM